MVLQQQNPGGMVQTGLPIQPQSTQLQPNNPQTQQLGANPNTNQTSPLLAQQLAGRPPVPGQPPHGMIQGQTGPMMQQRPTLLPEQQIRAQLQPVAQNTDAGQAANSTPVTSTGGDGPSVSSEDLEGLEKDISHELGDLGMGDGDFLDMGDDFNIFEFTDAMDDLDDMPGDDNKTATSEATSSASGTETSVTSSISSSSTTTAVSASLSGTTLSSIPTAPVGTVSTSATNASSVIASNANIATSSAANAGMINTAGRLVNQPPPYTAAGSVTVPLRGVLPQGTVSGAVPGAPATIIRGPPPPYPGPGLAPNTSPIAPGGPPSIQTSKV